MRKNHIYTCNVVQTIFETFISQKPTAYLFQLVEVEPTFLALPVEQWVSDRTYLKMRGIVTSLCVVNDAAERAVKFGSDFTQVITKSEDRRQDILQTVELARRAFPHATRKCFLCVNASSSIDEMMKAAEYDARPKE